MSGYCSAVIDFPRMLSLDDNRWDNLTGGCKTRFDPRLLLARLATGQETASVWRGLWNELHHQGDVGEASYAAVRQLVSIHRERSVVDWNTYSIVAVIELARTERKNPAVPEWLEKDYFSAIQELAGVGASEILRTQEHLCLSTPSD